MNNVKGASYFVKENCVKKQYKYLDKNIDCDIAIVGGGITGAILSKYISEGGDKKICLIDRKRIAYGSTSIATAILQYELDKNIMPLEKYLPENNVLLAYQLCNKALNEIKTFIETNGNACKYVQRDCFLYTEKKNEVAEFAYEFQKRKENGFDVEFYDDVTNPFEFPIKAGIYSKKGGAELDPFLFTLQLLEVAEKNGVDIYENTNIENICYDGEFATLNCEYGYSIKAKKVIIATGFTDSLVEGIETGSLYSTFNLVTSKVDNFKGWYNNALIRDNEDKYIYLRTTDDNRVIIGGRDTKIKDKQPTQKVADKNYDKLLQRLKDMFNFAENLSIDYSYCGTFRTTDDNIGLFSQDDCNDKLYYAICAGANGILFSILAGIYYDSLFNKNTKIKELEMFNVNRYKE